LFPFQQHGGFRVNDSQRERCTLKNVSMKVTVGSPNYLVVKGVRDTRRKVWRQKQRYETHLTFTIVQQQLMNPCRRKHHPFYNLI